MDGMNVSATDTASTSGLGAGVNDAATQASAVAWAQAVTAAGLRDGDTRGPWPNGADAGAPPAGSLQQAGQFAQGVGEGVWDGAKGMVQGLGSLATGAYHLATSSDARQQALNTTVRDAQAVGQFAKTAVTDPAKAVRQVSDAAGAAWNNASTAYHQAAANGHGAEFLGKMAGQGAVLLGTAVVPGGAEAEAAGLAGDAGRMAELAGDLGKTAEVAGDAGKTADAAGAAEGMAAQAGHMPQEIAGSANGGSGATKAAGGAESVTTEAAKGERAVTSAGDTAKTEDVSAKSNEAAETDPVSKALSDGKKLSDGHPPVELDHVFEGEISLKKGQDAAKGFHHAPDDSLHPQARVVQETAPRNAQGVYEARIEVKNPTTGATYTKQSTMFPDTMSREDVVKSMQNAFANATQRSGNKFTGPSGHGFDITGYTSGSGPNTHIRTGYPVYTK